MLIVPVFPVLVLAFPAVCKRALVVVLDMRLIVRVGMRAVVGEIVV